MVVITYLSPTPGRENIETIRWFIEKTGEPVSGHIINALLANGGLYHLGGIRYATETLK